MWRVVGLLIVLAVMVISVIQSVLDWFRLRRDRKKKPKLD